MSDSEQIITASAVQPVDDQPVVEQPVDEQLDQDEIVAASEVQESVTPADDQQQKESDNVFGLTNASPDRAPE